jgi:hypothetical protein
MSEPGQSEKASVFAPVNQQAMVAKIASVGDDELSGCFFGDAVTDAESPTTRAFDIGAREVGEPDEEGAPSGPFGVPLIGAPGAPFVNPATAPVPSPTSATPGTAPHGGGGGSLDQDAAARQAFILGGPGAIRGE